MPRHRDGNSSQAFAFQFCKTVCEASVKYCTSLSLHLHILKRGYLVIARALHSSGNLVDSTRSKKRNSSFKKALLGLPWSHSG